MEYKERIRFAALFSAVIGMIFYFIFDNDNFWLGYVTANVYWGFHAWYFLAKERGEAARG